MKHLITSLKQLSTDHPEGFTVDLNLNFITTGYVVAVPQTQNSFGDEGLNKVLEIALKNDYCIGGWLNPQNGKFYWDASIVTDDLEKAKELGRKFGQLAIFDLDEQRIIWL